MSADDITMEQSQDMSPELQTDESLILSMDNIVMEGEAPDYSAVLDQTKAETDGADAVEEEEAISIPEKIAGMLEGFGTQNPAGEDPRYGDEFVLIKTEIDKLAFNDYNAVLTLCEEILRNQAKDMRIAGYYLLANTYIHGLHGLADGLMLYRLLLERFADTIYPQKENAQNMALQWLSSSKLLAYTKQHHNEATMELVKCIGDEVEQLNKHIISMTNDETLCLKSIYNWVKETTKNLKPAEPSKPAVENKPQAATTAQQSTTQSAASNTHTASAEPVKQSTSSVDLSSYKSGGSLSDTELFTLMRKIVNQLNEDKDYLRSIAYARAARWGGMILPPNDKGKTRITPPRASGVNEIKMMLAQEDFEGALRKCEGIFFEMGGHMLLDLQYFANKAAKGIGKHDVANYIGYEAAALLRRLPGLEVLRFDDDTPFANAETAAWLGKLNGNTQSAASIVSASEEDAGLVDAINAASEKANEADLNKALAVLKDYRPRTEKQRFQLRLAMAQLCLDHGRAELSYPILEDLLEQAKSTSLALWDTGLAISVAKQLQNALRSLLSTATEQNRTHYEQRLSEVVAQMCRWDLALTAQIL